MWLYPLVSLGLFGAVFGAGLAYASKKFAVVVDPRVEEVTKALPGINCGACGYPGCAGYAAAVVAGHAPPNKCVPGGAETARNVARLIGLEGVSFERKTAFVRCQGAPTAVRSAAYSGPRTCTLAALVGGGPFACTQACLMMGDCFRACPYDAISWQADGLPVILEDKCIACGKCVAACPRELIILRPDTKQVMVTCRNQDKGAVARKKCTTACIACTKCVQTCPVQAIGMEGNVAAIDTAKCILCGQCVDVCPTKAITDHRPGRN
ncbi:RnfABCDGE type electron transport complex subunit B [bacterium]|nr:RnfABCDGE type electron transport complex subunit B [bacterium]